MRQAIRTKGPRQQHSITATVTAPIGGWNTRDSLASMSPTEAIVLKNWFPTTTDCEIRGGQEDYATTITGTVETLAVHTAMDGTEQMFAVTDADCYDVSSSGVASAESWTDQDDGKYQWINMGDGTSNWLVMFNGVDEPKYYNGSSWTEVDAVSTPAITGVTSTTLIAPCQYHGRLFLLQKDSLSFWYLPAGVVGGAASEFNLASFASRGGYLMWAAKWTFDGGDGIDDYIVFMTSEGEAIVYTGTDPSSAVNWARLGTYYLGKPIGRRSFIQFGGDLLAVTQEGVFNMSEGLEYSKINERVALTDKIKSSFNDAARSYGSTFGWEAVHFPIRNAMLFNIPKSGGTEQYVVNTITGAWCQFTNWSASTFVVYNDELYYGGNTVVQKAWTGRSDDGANIIAEGQAAFNSFGADSQNKRFMMFRPLVTANSALAFLTDLEIDFNTTYLTGVATSGESGDAVWDTATWDGASWSGGLLTIRNWTSPSVSVGYYASAKIKVETNSTEVHWITNDFLIETGGVI